MKELTKETSWCLSGGEEQKIELHSDFSAEKSFDAAGIQVLEQVRIKVIEVQKDTFGICTKSMQEKGKHEGLQEGQRGRHCSI
ncbi:MAG: hypothetical protein U0L49_11400 [Eubacterium sp.]|nr:hypothetical protein [Eubacterium sp.]